MYIFLLHFYWKESSAGDGAGRAILYNIFIIVVAVSGFEKRQKFFALAFGNPVTRVSARRLCFTVALATRLRGMCHGWQVGIFCAFLFGLESKVLVADRGTVEKNMCIFQGTVSKDLRSRRVCSSRGTLQ